MFEHLQDIQLHDSEPVAKAMECISRNIALTGGYGIVLVLDDDERLIGVITDGDIRRALVGGHTLNSTLDTVMNKNPVTTTHKGSYHQLLRLFERGIRHVPVVDKDRHVIDLILYSELGPGPSSVGTMLRAKAPVRISFAGGGTDMTPVIEKNKGAVISATINRYCYAELILRDDSKIVLSSRDFNQQVVFRSLKDIQYDGNLDILKAAVKISKPDFGFEIYTSSDVPPGSGLGASSSLTVAIIGLIEYIRTGQIDEYRIADLAFQSERVELQIRGGWQDQYAAVFGGLNYIEFDRDGVVVHPLRLKDSIRYELESNLVLCFTNLTRNSGEIHKETVQNLQNESTRDAAEYAAMLDLVEDVRRALLTGDLFKFGQLLDQAWQLKKAMNVGITNPEIDRLYNLAKEAGALGGKLLGAGNGGYLMFYCTPLRKHEIQKVLQDTGVAALTFNLDPKGLRIWPSQKMPDSAI